MMPTTLLIMGMVEYLFLKPTSFFFTICRSYDADFLEEDDLEAAFEDFLQETHSHYRMFPSYHP